MGRVKLQIEPADAAKELEPEKQPPHPAKDKELKQRCAEPAQPPAGPRERASAVSPGGVPGVDIHSGLTERQKGKAECQNRNHNLCQHRVASAEAALHKLVESPKVLLYHHSRSHEMSRGIC
jgi:hypothetical protein